jgi:hypothetical protein
VSCEEKKKHCFKIVLGICNRRKEENPIWDCNPLHIFTLLLLSPRCICVSVCSIQIKVKIKEVDMGQSYGAMDRWAQSSQ